MKRHFSGNFRIWLFALWLIGFSCNPVKKATKEYKLGEYQYAIDRLEKVAQKEPSNGLVQLYIAESYKKSNRPKDAAPYYQRAIAAGIKNDSVSLHYAYCLRSSEKYDQARVEIEKLLKSTTDPDILKRATEEQESLDKIEEIKEKKNYYTVRNLEDINTEDTDYSPVYSDGFLYFTSNRKNDRVYAATGEGYTNLFRVKTEGAKVDVATVEMLSEAINTPTVNEGTITFTPDGNTMVFARGNARKKSLTSDVDLYMSRRRNGLWTAPIMLERAVNDPSWWDSTPAFSRDGRTLYFASDRPGGYGGIDIYYARMTARGRFSEAKNMGPEINTGGNDMFPYIADDGSLYFSSDGHPGFGGLDLFVAKRENGKLMVENLGLPMNSSADDFGIYLFKADRGFFASNRDGGKGFDDVYTFRNEDPELRVVNFYLAGITMTRNEEGELVVLPQTKVKIVDYNGNVLDEVETQADGKFTFRVYEHENYSLIGEKKSKTDNYLTTRVPFSTVGRGVDRTKLTELITDITYDTLVVLEKQEINKVFVLENIYYDLDRWEIRPDAAVELDKLVTILNDNPEIKIELSSHTDSRNTDQYNERLSDRRARSAVDYIVQQGIDPSRLVAKGYGESKPMKVKDAQGNEVILTEKYIETFQDNDERERLHQLNRRTEFKIIEINRTGLENSEDKYFDDDFEKQ